ncbi:MAG: hypothetical protein A2075_16455 [Geobacteraceae bacterium GWC2_58_44]|nr:MAG: hypothetical protein A2075_16455 [Geobacteraceae bacterium GWC2_58_44]
MSGSVSRYVHNIADNCHGKVVVEIGAGKGLVKEISLISLHAKLFIGIDPSRNVSKNPYVHTFQTATLEECQLEDASVDIIYSIYVMEHILDPGPTLARAYSILKPGGKFYAITVNKKHYFASISQLFDRLELKKAYIEKVMRAKYELAFGFKTYYNFNDHDDVCKAMSANNYKSVNIFEETDNSLLDYYFPRPFKFMPYLISRLFSRSSWTKNVMVIEATK